MKPWKTSEIRYMEQNYMTMLDKDMAALLGRSIPAVKAARYRNGLMRPKGAGCFKPGQDPWNKGKSFNPGGKSVDTQFKAGQDPWNTREDGSITVRYEKGTGRYYQYIKVNGTFVPLHRHIIEQRCGKIGKGMVVIFKDGNSMNASPDNLELINRREQLRRNHNVKKASESMKKHWNYCVAKETFGIKTSRHYVYKNKLS